LPTHLSAEKKKTPLNLRFYGFCLSITPLSYFNYALKIGLNLGSYCDGGKFWLVGIISNRSPKPLKFVSFKRPQIFDF
jgi:hypothetical protein